MTHYRPIFAFITALVWPATAFAYGNPLVIVAFSLIGLALLSSISTVIIGALTACIARHKQVRIAQPFARLFNLVEAGVIGSFLGLIAVFIVNFPQDASPFIVLFTMVLAQITFVVWRWPREIPEIGIRRRSTRPRG